jgi:hypothetical protein
MTSPLIRPALRSPMSALAALPPVGAVLPYAGLLADTDADATSLAQIKANLASQGWLFCDGHACEIARYPLLHAAIGTSFGAPKAGWFNVPDLRGRFVRGVDGGAPGRPDPQAADRVAAQPGGASGDHVGSAQADAFQGHEHYYTSTVEGPETAMPDPGPDPPPVPVLVPLPDQLTTGIAPDTQGDGTPRIAPETRPVNVALNFIIRYA